MPAPRTFSPTSTNPFAPGQRSLLAKAQACGIREVAERWKRMQQDDFCEENKKFYAFWYTNALRMQLARTASTSGLFLLTPRKDLFRHELKRKAKALQEVQRRHEASMARRFLHEGEEGLDYLDNLTNKFLDNPEVVRLKNAFFYTIMQYFTKHGGQETQLVATWCMASFLHDFAFRRYAAEIDQHVTEFPLVVYVRNEFPEQEWHLVAQIAEALVSRFYDKHNGGILDGSELLADKDIGAAFLNLMSFLVDPDRILSKSFGKNCTAE